MKAKKVVIFARVSTLQQDNERQVQELTKLIKSQGKELVKVFQEQISGKAHITTRQGFLNMVAYCQKNKVNEVYCWEISRIGRNPIEVLKVVELLKELNINLYIHNFGINSLEHNGTENIVGKLFINILSAFAEIESTQIKQRLQSGYNKHISEGGKVGRGKGWKEDEDVFLAKHSDIVKLINSKNNYPLRNIAKITNKSITTVVKVKKHLMQ